MHVHRTGKPGLASRFALTEAISNGMMQRAAATALCVAPATADRWWHRGLAANEQEPRAVAQLALLALVLAGANTPRIRPIG